MTGEPNFKPLFNLSRSICDVICKSHQITDLLKAFNDHLLCDSSAIIFPETNKTYTYPQKNQFDYTTEKLHTYADKMEFFHLNGNKSKSADFLCFSLNNDGYLLLECKTQSPGPELLRNLPVITEELAKAIDRLESIEGHQKTEQNYHDLIEHLPEMICEINRKGEITFANQFALDRFGYSQLDIDKGLSITEVFAEEERERVGKNFESSLHNAPESPREYVAQKRDGTQIPVMLYVAHIIENEKVKGIRAVMIDISKRKEIEDQLRKQKSEYRKALNQQSVLSELALIFNTLEDFDILVNNSLETIGKHTNVSRVYIFEDDETGLSTSNSYEWVNEGVQPQKDDLQDIPYEIIPSWKSILSREGRIYSENIKELPRDMYDILAPQKIRSIIVYPLYFRKQVFGFIGFDECNLNRQWSTPELELLRSVSGIFSNAFSRKKIMETLEEAKNQAEAANREKARFLSTMSHEIRTPLSAVINLSRLIDATHLPETQKDYLKKIKISANNLLDIINDILDFSKIEAGKINLDQTEFQLDKLFKDIFHTMEAKAQEKNLEFSYTVDKNISKPLLGDKTRLKQILLNLINNAIKFTDKGSVRYSVEQLNDDQQQYQLMFSVSDTGIGISKEYLSTLYDSFTQEDNTTTRKYGGTGLGLAISKELIELMGGKLNVDSSKGEGSTFSFTIELKYLSEDFEHQKEPAKLTHTNLENRRILVVEDNQLIQLTTKAFLKEWGVEADLANNGLEGLDMIREKTYDLILMDNQMPVMNGIEAAQKIRAEIDSKIPIIAMTADVVKEVIDQCLSSGMNDYITKPYEPGDLKAVLLKNL